jgi:hypothetical protein
LPERGKDPCATLSLPEIFREKEYIAEIKGALLKTFFNVTGGMHKEKTRAILDDMAAIVLEIRGYLDDRKAHTEPEE